MNSKKPANMPASDWEKIKNLPPETRGALVSMFKNMKQNPSPEVTENTKSIKEIQLPLWPEPTRGTPNSFLRSALFAGIQAPRRKYLEDEKLGSQSNYLIRYTGQQLIQADLDVWEQIIHLKKEQNDKDYIVFKGHPFLKQLGRSTGGNDRKWLRKTISRLIATAIRIEHKQYWYEGSLLIDAGGDEERDLFAVGINPKLLNLYTENDFTAIEWAHRKRLKSKALALWLHGYFSSHKEPYPVKIETIKTLSGSQTKTLKHFKSALKRAVEELENVTDWTLWIEGDLVFCNKPIQPENKKPLLKRQAEN